MTVKRTLSGVEAVKLAEHWLCLADGDRDEAVADVRRYSSGGRRRQNAVIAAIDFIVDRNAQLSKEEQ